MPKWLVATFEPASLFSLRTTFATGKGGKTLLLPTPYAVRMALLDACFRSFGPSSAESVARQVFRTLKGSAIRFRPPEHCVVNNTFLKTLDRERDGDSPFKQTISYREFAAFSGELAIAIDCETWATAQISQISALLPHINTFGKRGSFWQFLHTENLDEALPPNFAVPQTELSPDQMLSHLTTQALDDFGTPLVNDAKGFDRVSTYGSATIKLEHHRILVLTAVPYRRRAASRDFTWYQRTL